MRDEAVEALRPQARGEDVEPRALGLGEQRSGDVDQHGRNAIGPRRSSSLPSIAATHFAWWRRAQSARTQPRVIPLIECRVDGFTSASQRWPRNSTSDDVHQPVVDEQRARQAEARVALAVPEEEARHREQQRERGGHDDVQLLARVQAARRAAAVEEPVAVVGVEAVDLADRRAAGCAGRRATTTSTSATAHASAV